MAGKAKTAIRLAILSIVLAITALSTANAADWNICTGTFSTVLFHEEAGDFLGTELRIITYSQTDPDLYQGSLVDCQGWPGKMSVVHPVCDGSTIRFTFPDYMGNEASFTGSVSKQGLEGTVTYSSGASEQWSLPRGKGYWD